MNYLSIEELIETVGRIVRSPATANWSRLIDAERALAALMRACGPWEGTPKDDAVHRIAEVLNGLLDLRPSLANHDERLAAEATRRLAANLGYEISDDDLANLIDPKTGDRPTHQERLVRINTILTASVCTARTVIAPPLLGLAGFSSRDTTARETRRSRDLRILIEDKLREQGSDVAETEIVDKAKPADHARATNPWRVAPPEDEVYSRHERNLCASQYLVSFDDHEGSQSALDRRVAADVAMPYFTIRRHNRNRPPEDGWHRIVDFHTNDLVEETANSVVAVILRFSDHIRDFAAWQRASEFVNAETFTHLRTAWEALDSAGRELIAKRTRLTPRRIEVALSSATAWAAISGRGRDDLKLALQTPRTHQGQLIRLKTEELDLLGEACTILGLSNTATLDVHDRLQETVLTGLDKLRIVSVPDAVTLVQKLIS